MNTSLLNMKIPELRSALSFADNYGIGDDFLFADIHYSSELRSLLYPMRLDGYMVVFVLSARLGMDINLNHYEIENGSMFFCTPGNLLHLTSNMTTDEERSDLHIVLVALSREFITNIHYDFNKLFAESLAILHHPYIDLTDNEVSIFRRYLKMMAEILGMQVEHKKEIMGSLFASVFYLMASVWSDRLAKAKNLTSEKEHSRANILFRRFIDLVTEYHDSQRNMGFYAEKLCLTPKYLSKLIKQVSGRSGPDWIDAFVILEAKNMLKYSSSNIKEIVYKLNFPNQSVFYKFFKAHTGMTPSEYRNS